MNVADGTSAKLSHYSEFEIGVLGVWRKVEAFVRPFTSSNEDDVHLLLGMPWLHAVDTKLRIRDSIIEIGDYKKGETVVKIKGPRFVESETQRLVLCPEGKEMGYNDSEISNDDDATSSDYSSGDESDDSWSEEDTDAEK